MHTLRGRLLSSTYSRNEYQILSDFIGKSATTTLDSPVRHIEIDGMRIAHLPLWMTDAHIEGMIKAWLLDSRCIFIDGLCSLFEDGEIPDKFPQVFGCAIRSNETLEQIITDKTALAIAKKELMDSGLYRYFLGNQEARLAHAAYIGWRIPTHDEQKVLFTHLSLGKIKQLGIPFPGYTSPRSWRLEYMGDRSFLISSGDGLARDAGGMCLDKKHKEISKGWFDFRCGYSNLVILN